MISRFASIERSVIKNGLFSTVWIFCLYIFFKFFNKKKIVFKNQIINLRPKTSDFSVFREIFMEHEYDLAIDRKDCLIIDLGANIGLSAMYFSYYYPGAFIYAIEADKENYNLLQTNTFKIKNIRSFNLAIWNENSPVFIEIDRPHWARKVSDHQTGDRVNGITLRKLVEDNGIKKIDLLKVDIEGSEIQLFQYLKNNKDLLNMIQNIIIETHDWMIPGCAKAVFNCLNETDYKLAVSGEKILIQLIKKNDDENLSYQSREPAQAQENTH